MNHSSGLARVRSRTAFLIAETVLAVLLFDWLFYRKPIGWTLGFYELALVLALIGTRPVLHTLGGKLATFGVAGLAVALAAQPGPLVVLMAMLGVVSLASVGRAGWERNAAGWIRRWRIFLASAWYMVVRDRWIAARWRKSGHGEAFGAPLSRWFIRWILPTVLAGFFLLLFAIANPLISITLEHIDRWGIAFFEMLDLSVVRIVMWVWVGIWVWGLFRVRIKSKRKPPPLPRTTPVRDTKSFIIRCLSLFNALFAMQSLLDVRYLWGGAQLPAGMTYAEYAHRGAYPLIATALLAGIFVLATFRPGGPTQHDNTARRLVLLWLAQNVFLTISSAYRLYLYVQIYSLTCWRVAAAVWMLLVACGLILIAIRIQQRNTNRWLVNVNFASALLVLYACCFINFNGGIAWFNVRHSYEVSGRGVQLDLSYMRNLGPEAIPALQWFANQNPASTKAISARANSDYLRAELEQSLSDWRGWTLRREVLWRY